MRSRVLLVLCLGAGPSAFVRSNASSDDEVPQGTFYTKYKETEKRSMRSFWKINHPQAYSVLDMRVRNPNDGGSQFEIVSVGDVMESLGYNNSMLPTPGDRLVSVDDIPVATGSLQDAIQNFMTAGGDDRTKIMDQQLVFPLVHATDTLQEEANWYCYQDRYPDVRKNIRKYDAQAIRNHYVLTGRAEGRDPKCDPGTAPDAHGYRLRGFMYINMVGLYQPDSFGFAPTDETRQSLAASKKPPAGRGPSRSRSGGASSRGGGGGSSGGGGGGGGSGGGGGAGRGNGRSRMTRENPNKGQAQEEKVSDNDRRRRAQEKKERGSGGSESKIKMLSKEEEEAERRRQEQMKAEQDRLAELDRLRNAADMKREKLIEEQRVRESWVTKRQDGEAFDFWMRIETEGPMGLTFNVGHDITEVQEVRPGSIADSNKVMPGDHLISVNGRNVAKMNPSASVRIIQASEWPRVLEFHAPEKKKSNLPEDDDESPLVLRITSPEVLRGDIIVSSADWGGEVPDMCQDYTIAEGSPANGCGSANDPVSWRAKEPAIVLIRRGQCAYTDKARAIQKGGSAVAALVVNTEEKVIEMPAGKASVDDIELPIHMMPSTPGSKLFNVLSWKLPVRGWIGFNNTCGDLIPQVGPATGQPFKNREQGGRFIIQTASQSGTFDWKLSSFGPEITDYSNTVILADPPQGCTPNGHRVRIKGAIALLERGGCGFADKVLAAQEAGAAAVIVMNNDVSVVAMMADDRVTSRITIPSLMISSRFMEFKVLMRRRKEQAIGRIVREKVIGNYDRPDDDDD